MVRSLNEAIILHITTVPESLGFLVGQAAYMRARGFAIYAVSSPGRFLEQYASQESVSALPVEMPRRITPFSDLRALVDLVKIMRRLRPQIIHAYTPKGGLLGMLSAWMAGVPVRIYHMMGLPMITATGYRQRLLKLTERISCHLAIQILCVSQGTRLLAINEGLCPANKIKVLANGSINGIDSQMRFNPARLDPAMRSKLRDQYGIPQEAVVVGYLGRIVRDKGLVELAHAWQMIAGQVGIYHLLIVGQFESQDPLPPEVEQYLKTGPQIHLTGYVEDNVPLYQAMDMLVLPTYREGFPVVPLEAAAMGLPVIATRIPGCTEAVVDGETGKLIPVRDAVALAQAINQYLAQPELRYRHGQAGRARVVCDYQPEVLWQATYKEYVRLLSGVGISLPSQQYGV